MGAILYLGPDKSPVARPALLLEVLLTRDDVGFDIIDERDLRWVNSVPAHLVHCALLMLP